MLYDIFTDPNLRFVLVSTVVLGCVSALVGTYNFFQKQALVGETIAHAMLPGVVLAFAISGVKNPYWLLLGAAISGWLSLLFIEWIRKERVIKADAALAIALTFFFGIGIMFMVSIQQMELGNQAGIDHYLFGKAAAMTDTDMRIFGIALSIVSLIVIFFYKEIKLVCFNEDYARTVGVPVRLTRGLMSFMTILVIATGIKAAGIILMAALVIAPASAASFWTKRYGRFLTLAMIFGGLGGFMGSSVSYAIAGMPTGPWIIVFLFAISLFSMLFAPGRGYVSGLLQKRKARKKIERENVLKKAYHILYRAANDSRILSVEKWSRSEKKVLNELVKRGQAIWVNDEKIALKDSGWNEGKRIYRLHCLWEIYLQRKMNIPIENMHSDAEYIEHVITPEVEKMILDDLGYCERFEPFAEIHAYLQSEQDALAAS